MTINNADKGEGVWQDPSPSVIGLTISVTAFDIINAPFYQEC